jgi:hypothetical protein
MFPNIELFLSDLRKLTHELFPDARLEIIYSRLDKLSLRLMIDFELFIDIYFNVESRRFDFSLIAAGNRVFGYDNLKSWHYHPFDDPDSHVHCEEPELRLILEETARVIASVKNKS